MAKSGGEESQYSFTYDVFLSFRGKDTRHTFIGYLHDHLKRKGIRAFIDDEMLKVGDVISPALSEAIEESKVFIVVLSKNYATSTWCLDELVKILDCSRKGNQQLVFSIFYHVDPSDVRHQKGKFGEAMNAHENRFDKERVHSWREALNQVCQRVGRHIKTGYEINEIEAVVDKVCKMIAPKRFNGKDPVGFEQRIEEVKSLLDLKPDDDSICMLGIYGLGGIGKTELAKALYYKIVHQFSASSFIENVREKSNKINGVEDLQRTLLSETYEVLQTELGSTSRGVDEIIGRLSKRKVLLVLDDVDDIEKQLNNLAGRCDWFGPGSRIIITTRDQDLLIRRVQKTYKMTELGDQHSLELFCENAFGKNHPEKGYEDLSSRAISYAKGLPLALKVIGSDLGSTKDLKDWKSVLEEYESHPHTDIQVVLQRSYERLQPNAKQVFLDIACFFKGKTKEYVEMILEEFQAPRNIKVLVNKSLLTVDEDGYLNMHDLIQDMGREVVWQEAPRKPDKRSRLWCYKDVDKVLTDDSESDAIEGIMLDPPQREEVDWSGNAFKKMKNLRILIVRNTSFLAEPKHLPNSLWLLDWEGYPARSFPPEFHPKDIIVFNLYKSHLTLENPFKKYSCLTTMDFTHNQSITVVPNVYGIPNLREITLDNCWNLIMVDESVGLLQKLVRLSVKACFNLRDFPRNMHLPSLEFLSLAFCNSLEHFPDIIKEMNKKLVIYMINTAIRELPDSIGNLTGLVWINMSNSMKLRYLPPSLLMLPNLDTIVSTSCPNLGEPFRRISQSKAAANGGSTLKILHLGFCGLSDEDLHAILKCFPELEELIAWTNNFVSLPARIKESALTSLDVSDCTELKKIPECASLRILNVYHCVKLEEISELPYTIQKVDASCCYSLTTETLDMLWSQVKKERRQLEVMMRKTEIPKWFDFQGNGGNPYFWARGKFPVVALALFFSKVKGVFANSRRHFVEVHLVINGQCVPYRGYTFYNFYGDHVLVCDLRVLFSEEEWIGLDAFLVRDWNLVQVSYEAPPTITLSSWGVYVYKQKTNMNDVQFMCPVPEYSDITSCANITVPPRDSVQAMAKMAYELGEEDVFSWLLREPILINQFQVVLGRNFRHVDDQENMHCMMNRRMQHEEMSRIMHDQLAEISASIYEKLAIATPDKVKILHDNIKTVKERLEGELEGKFKALNENSTLAWILRTTKNSENESAAREEGSSSRHQGSSEVLSRNQRRENFKAAYWNGMRDGLVEAGKSFPNLDIDTTARAAKNKGMEYTLSEIEVLATPLTKLYIKVYIGAMISALEEAKLTFSTLNVHAILSVVKLQRLVTIQSYKYIREGEQDMKTLIKGITNMTMEINQRFPKLDIMAKLNPSNILSRAGSQANNPGFSSNGEGKATEVAAGILSPSTPTNMHLFWSGYSVAVRSEDSIMSCYLGLLFFMYAEVALMGSGKFGELLEVDT